MIARRTGEITTILTSGPSEKVCQAADASGVPEDRSKCPDKADWCLGTGGRPSDVTGRRVSHRNAHFLQSL